MQRFAGRRVLVVGDLMLDRYVTGTVSRISPEAPVPVVQVRSEDARPGGAANVALNVCDMGGEASVAGLIGGDAHGDRLRRMLEARGVRTGAVVAWAGGQTTIKTRVVADRQQVVRVDREDAPESVPDEVVGAVCERVRAEVAQADGVLIEDYGKGMVRQCVVDAVVTAARARGIPVGMDPKDNVDLCLPALTFATPNLKEAIWNAELRPFAVQADPASDERLARVASILQRKWNCGTVIITLGPQGMYIAQEARPAVWLPTRAREVFDVSGAGDTVIAVCMLAWASGASCLDAAALANAAAGVVVGKLGTATCTPAELLASLDA